MSVHHHEASAIVAATAQQLFAYMDDPYSLAAHMQQSSWRMGGGHMELETDTGRGQAVGSRIRLTGRVLGVPLWLEERVTRREAPLRKQWQTTAPPRLLVIGRYRIGFEIAPAQDGSLLRVFIDYELPDTLIASWFGRYYARWCIRRMVNDAARHFSSPAAQISHSS